MSRSQSVPWSPKKVLVVSMFGAPVGTAATLFLAYVSFIAGAFATWPGAKPEGILLLGGICLASGLMAVVALVLSVLCFRALAILAIGYFKYGTCPVRGPLPRRS